ncbi:MAG: amidohydrolase family protein, partial [Woeseiaceae bacterium]
MSRSQALTLASLGVVLGLYGCGQSETDSSSSAVEQSTVADAIYFNGNIVTVDDDNPRATAVAIKDGKIIYVGDVRGSNRLSADSTRQIDLQGRTMVPGFVDAHGHVISAGFQAASANLLPDPDGPVNSFAQVVETIEAWEDTAKGQEFVAETGWIVGFG